MTNSRKIPLTEQSNPASRDLDALSPLELARLMNRQDAGVPAAVAEALPEIAQAMEAMAKALRAGGRVFYVGAGTSGRLGVLDAVELLPTFGLEPGRVVPVLAGGSVAVTQSVEGAEDLPEQGRADLESHGVSPGDVVVGIAASGRTPYVLGGLQFANEVGAVTVAVVCNPGSSMAAISQIPIVAITGPEVLAGSTRLKAGTAQKLVLNTLSTGAMVLLGKVYGNLMVDVQPTNSKLRERALRIVMEITGLDRPTAQDLLEQAGWNVKVAVVMNLAGVDRAAARARLEASQGQIRQALMES
jgi:N-acetylmuramic acid 6-phosphate etherase